MDREHKRAMQHSAAAGGVRGIRQAASVGCGKEERTRRLMRRTRLTCFSKRMPMSAAIAEGR
jgi:hypothetical protein